MAVTAIFIASLFASLLTLSQVNGAKTELTSRLQVRSEILAESLAESIVRSYDFGWTGGVQKVVDRFTRSEGLVGLSVFDNSGAIVASSRDMPLPDDGTLINTVMLSHQAIGEFVQRGNNKYYVLITPLYVDDIIVGSLAVAQNATYIDRNIRDIWQRNLVRLLFQILIFAFTILVLVRWIFFYSISKMVESLQALRRGNSQIDMIPNSSFFKPLAGEISKVTKSLRQARQSASDEARMRLEKIDSPWTAERLREFIKAYLKDRQIFVLSNREPYVHNKTKNKIEWSVPAGGVITALEPVMEASSGTWIAHGSGNADEETADKNGKIMVPPDEPTYTLKRVFLTEREIEGYYVGFSNEALWPLCLMAHTRPLFRSEDWVEYRKVNAKFAKTLLAEIRNVKRPIVLVQDYHLALVPEMIKKSRPDALVAIFWHIPWPSPAQFNICPWRKELLRGMLQADLVGFHTQQDCNNFIETVGNEIESRIDYEQFSIFRGTHKTAIKPFPISIAFPGSAEGHAEPSKRTLEVLGIRSEHLVLGVDRLDYTKGILERFKGLEFFLDANPAYQGNLTLLQIASPTREMVEKYREFAILVTEEAERINKKFAANGWKPIVLEKKNYSHEQLIHLYQFADVCLITSLHDGMNLVAKEFVAARNDESGVLILSQFAGASRDLNGALLVNPYSAEETSAAILTALLMPKTEQQRRMKIMRTSVSDYNIYRWSAELIKALLRLE